MYIILGEKIRRNVELQVGMKIKRINQKSKFQYTRNVLVKLFETLKSINKKRIQYKIVLSRKDKILIHTIRTIYVQ